MTWLREELEIGLEASYLLLDSKLMKLFETSYQPSVSLGSVPHLCLHSRVFEDLNHFIPSISNSTLFLIAYSNLQFGSYFWCWACD